MRGDGLLDQPSCRRQVAGWPAAFAATAGRDHEARSHAGTAPQRVIAAERHYAQPSPQATATLAQRPFARARLCCPRRHHSYGLSRQSAALSATSRSAVIRRVFAIRSGLGWAADLPHFETSILSLVPPPLRRGTADACVRFVPRRRWPSPFSDGLGAPTLPQLALSTPRRGLLAGAPDDAAAIRLTLRPQGLLAPLANRPRPYGRAAGHLYFRAFTPRGRPPGAPDMTTWAIGRLPGRDSHPLDRCCYGLH